MRPSRSLIDGLLIALVVASAPEAWADPGGKPGADPTACRASCETWARYADAARHSADLRLRIAFSEGRAEIDDRGLATAPELIPLETLVEQARGSTDPLVLSMLLGRCERLGPPQRRCDPLDFATRWVDADRQNQVAWLALASVHRRRHDATAEQAAFERASNAPQWHEYAADLLTTLVRSLPHDASRYAHYDALRRTSAIAMAYGADASLRTRIVADRCRDPQSRDACLRVLDTMSRDADDLLTSNVAARLSVRYGADPTIAARRQQRSDAVYWVAMQRARTVPDGAMPTTDGPALEQAIAFYEEKTRYSEIEIGTRWLADHGIAQEVAAADLRAWRTEQRRAYDARQADDGRAAAVSAGSARSTAASP